MNSENPDLLHGSVFKTLIKLSVPILAAMFLETVYNLTDAVWVGQSGVLSLASVNLSSFALWIIFALACIVTTGTNALVAQKLGEAVSGARAEAEQEAVEIAQLSLMLVALVGFIEAFVCVTWGRDLLLLMAGNAENVGPAVDLGYSYLGFICLFAPVHCLNEGFSAILRAYGDTKTPLKVFTVGFLVNFVLDPLFIFGWGPIPALDVFGAALATNISFVIVCLYFMILFSSGRLAFVLPKTRPQRFNWQYVKGIVGIGFPPSIASVIFSLVYMIISPAVSHFGPEALAALGIGHRLESLNYTICTGFSMACITMVGQCVGAGLYGRAKETAWVGIKLALGVNVFVFSAFMLVPGYLVALFGNDPVMTKMAVSYLRILAVSQFFSGTCVILEGVFSGTGRTVPLMCASIPCSLARIPMIYIMVFTLGWGVSSIWWTASIMTIVRASIVIVMFLMGVWLPRDIYRRASVYWHHRSPAVSR